MRPPLTKRTFSKLSSYSVMWRSLFCTCWPSSSSNKRLMVISNDFFFYSFIIIDLYFMSSWNWKSTVLLRSSNLMLSCLYYPSWLIQSQCTLMSREQLNCLNDDRLIWSLRRLDKMKVLPVIVENNKTPKLSIYCEVKRSRFVYVL